MYRPRRTILDLLLVEAARAAGAKIREATTFRELIWQNDRVSEGAYRPETGSSSKKEPRLSWVPPAAAHRPAAPAGRRLTATGFGNTLFRTRYTTFQQDGIGSTFRVAPILGINTPTAWPMRTARCRAACSRERGPARDALTASWQTLYWNGRAEPGYPANTTASTSAT